MKELNELKELVKLAIEKREKPNRKDFEDLENQERAEEAYEFECEFYEKFLRFNFLAYNVVDNTYNLFETYNEAKNFCEQGGQVLVIDKEKVYTYKVKNEEEYRNYLKNQIRKESYNTMNYYGI